MIRQSSTLNMTLWALLALVWSSSYAVIKIGVATIDPMVLVSGRLLIGAALVFLVMRLLGQRLTKSWRLAGLCRHGPIGQHGAVPVDHLWRANG